MRVETFRPIGGYEQIRVQFFPPHGSTFYLTIPEARQLYTLLTPLLEKDANERRLVDSGVEYRTEEQRAPD